MDVDCKSLLPCQQTPIKQRRHPFKKELGMVTGIQWHIFLMHFGMLTDSPPLSSFRALSSDPVPTVVDYTYVS